MGSFPFVLSHNTTLPYLACMAISQKNLKTLINQQFIVDEAKQTADDIYSVQLPIAKNRAWENISKQLATKPYTVVTTSRGVILTMPYLVQMRFMDMRKDAHGNKKRHYTPIYNKIVWGFIYGFLYKRLIFGISRDMNEALTQRLTNSGYKIG